MREGKNNLRKRKNPRKHVLRGGNAATVLLQMVMNGNAKAGLHFKTRTAYKP